VALGDDGTLKRLDQFGGRASAKETPRQYVPCNVRDFLLLFTARGSCHGVPVHRISTVARRSDRGTSVTSLVDLQSGDEVVAAVPIGQNPATYLVTVTAQGQVKRTLSSEYVHARSVAINAVNLEAGDAVVAIEPAEVGAELLIHTKQGKAIRFSAEEVRVTKRSAGGVRAIRLEDGDEVAPGNAVVRGPAVLVLTAAGVGRRAPVADYPVQGRDGSGVRSIRVTDKTGPVVTTFVVEDRTSLECIDGSGRVILIDAKEVPLQDRSRPGIVISEGIASAVVLPRRP
jgi:DNA gyrase subunit A